MIRQLMLCTLLLIAALPASADVWVTYVETLLGGAHHVEMSVGNPVANNVIIGIYRWQDANNPYIYESMCIDLEHLANGNPIHYECVPLTEARTEPGITSGQLSPYRAQLLELYWGQFRQLVVNDQTAIAFHLGIYEIVYDGDSMTFTGNYLDNSYDFEGSVFDGSDGGNSTKWPIAVSWLQQLNLSGDSTDLIAWSAEGAQDQITEDGFTPVPVAGSSWGRVKALY